MGRILFPDVRNEKTGDMKYPDARIPDASQYSRHPNPVQISWILTSLKKSAARWHRDFEAVLDWLDWTWLPCSNGY
jgi:hypothetical protein